MQTQALWRILILWRDGDVEEIANGPLLPALLDTAFRTAETLSAAAALRPALEVRICRDEEIVLTIKVERGVPLDGSAND